MNQEISVQSLKKRRFVPQAGSMEEQRMSLIKRQGKDLDYSKMFPGSRPKKIQSISSSTTAPPRVAESAQQGLNPDEKSSKEADRLKAGEEESASKTSGNNDLNYQRMFSQLRLSKQTTSSQEKIPPVGPKTERKSSQEQPGSPDWTKLDHTTRNWKEIIEKSQRKEVISRDKARFRKDPLAYDHVRETKEWAIVRPTQIRWSPINKQLLVLSGMGECMALVAFTELGALAQHLTVRDKANTRWKQRQEHAHDMELFAAELRSRLRGRKTPVHIHFVSSNDPYTGIWMGRVYRATLEAMLGDSVPHTFQMHQYEKPNGPRDKHRFNIIANPATKTVEIKQSWMREVDFLGHAGRQGEYPGFKRFQLNNLPPNIQPASDEPYLKRLLRDDLVHLPSGG